MLVWTRLTHLISTLSTLLMEDTDSGMIRGDLLNPFFVRNGAQILFIKFKLVAFFSLHLHSFLLVWAFSGFYEPFQFRRMTCCFWGVNLALFFCSSLNPCPRISFCSSLLFSYCLMISFYSSLSFTFPTLSRLFVPFFLPFFSPPLFALPTDEPTSPSADLRACHVPASSVVSSGGLKSAPAVGTSPASPTFTFPLSRLSSHDCSESRREREKDQEKERCMLRHTPL